MWGGGRGEIIIPKAFPIAMVSMIDISGAAKTVDPILETISPNVWLPVENGGILMSGKPPLTGPTTKIDNKISHRKNQLLYHSS